MTELARSRPGEHARRRLALALMVAAVMFPVMASPAGAAPVATASVNVVPASGLQPGAQVSVTASGFPPGAPVQVDECAAPPASPHDPSRCTPVADSLLLTGPDGSVHSTATVVSGPSACPAGPHVVCEVSVIAVGAGSEADAPIAFSGPAPAAPMTTVPAPPPAVTTIAPPAPTTAPPVRAASPSDGVSVVRARASAPRGGGSRPWALGLVALVVAAGVAGGARAHTGLRRAGRGRPA